MTTWQPSQTQYSPTKSEQGQVVTGPMDSPRQREVTSPGQGPPTELYQEQEERARDKAVEATCSVGQMSIQETVSKAKLPAVSLPGPSRGRIAARACSAGLGSTQGANTAETSTPPTWLRKTQGPELI